MTKVFVSFPYNQISLHVGPLFRYHIDLYSYVLSDSDLWQWHLIFILLELQNTHEYHSFLTAKKNKKI